MMFSTLSFECDKCHSEINEEIRVPDTNMDDDEGAFSEETIDCPVCKKTFDIEVNNRGGLVLASIFGIPLDHGAASSPYIRSIYEQSEEELRLEEDYRWYLSVNQQTIFQYFSSSMDSLNILLTTDIKDRYQKDVLHRMLLVQCIASMEAYLSDTLITHVLSDELHLKKLFDVDKELGKAKYSVTEFLDDEDLPKKLAKLRLARLLYHKLPTIEKLYREILWVCFDYGSDDNREELFRAIDMRHDCVHRNGKTMDGDDLRIINEKYVSEIIVIIESFISKIEEALEWDDDIPF